MSEVEKNGGGWFWQAAFVFLIGLCGWNIYRNQILSAAVASEKESAGAESKLITTIANTHRHELGFVGRELIWSEEMTVLGEGTPTPPSGRRLVLAVSELSCNTCRDDETTFAKEMAAEFGVSKVQIVVHSLESRFARSYVRMNQIPWPIYFDEKGDFFRYNDIGDTPMLFLVDERNKIAAAHFPLPDQDILCMPFHTFCERFLAEE